MDVKEKFEVEWLLSQISPMGNKKTLKTGRPKDGIAAFVWRMVRFDSGIDTTFPMNCYIYLANQMVKDGVFESFNAFHFGPEEKAVLDKLDPLIDKCTEKLGLNKFAAAKRFRNLFAM